PQGPSPRGEGVAFAVGPGACCPRAPARAFAVERVMFVPSPPAPLPGGEGAAFAVERVMCCSLSPALSREGRGKIVSVRGWRPLPHIYKCGLSCVRRRPCLLVGGRRRTPSLRSSPSDRMPWPPVFRGSRSPARRVCAAAGLRLFFSV